MEQKEQVSNSAQIAQNGLLGEVLFSDIPQQGFFIYQGVKLMKFGKYGMGVDINGTVAKVFSDDMKVIKADFT